MPVRDVPEYLEAPDNEDSGEFCECGEPSYDDAPHPYTHLGLCYTCLEEAQWEAHCDQEHDRMQDYCDEDRYGF